MPRDIPVGNGNLLVAFDRTYRLAELYYPSVGQANHLLGRPFRFGVWSDGVLSWTHDDTWVRTLEYEPDTLVTNVKLVNQALGLELTCHDCVDFDYDLYLRRIEIVDLFKRPREIRLFFYHDLDIGGSIAGDTAYYDPVHRALFHYKRKFWFMINAEAGGQTGLSSYAVGYTGQWLEGTWKDAEDGLLSRNAIAQGSVDSTAAIHLNLEDTAVVHYWLCAAGGREEALRINAFVGKVGPERILKRVRSYRSQWLTIEHPHIGIPDEVKEFYKRSLLILRTQIDNRGAIIAANDSEAIPYNNDSYSYLWPRDGALVAHALDLAGYRDISQRYFNFVGKLLSPGGYFLHKYNPDGTVGSSWHPWIGPNGEPELGIQEDETALTLYALWEHYALSNDLGTIRTLYHPLIEPAGDWLLNYRDRETGLPETSWDLWEERRGIHLYTVASVWAGLAAAASFAEVFGDSDRATYFSLAAREIREAAIRHMVDPATGIFYRALIREEGKLRPDKTLDASMAGVFLYGMLPPDDETVVRTMEAVSEKLLVRTDIGGIARYQQDWFHHVSEDWGKIPGNPWFICTLWVAQWLIAKADHPRQLKQPMDMIQWCMSHALLSGVLPEQINPFNGEPLSVSPLTWSHAEFIATVCRWEERYRRLTDERLHSA